MKLTKDRDAIQYNDFLTLAGIPPEAFDYRLGNRSALEWVIDQYRVRRDERGDITSDPNRADDEQYIVRLIGQVITVSLETNKTVAGLPPLALDRRACYNGGSSRGVPVRNRSCPIPRLKPIEPTMRFLRILLLPLFLIGLAASAQLARAAGTVELELVGDARGSAMIFQDWAQALEQGRHPKRAASAPPKSRASRGSTSKARPRTRPTSLPASCSRATSFSCPAAASAAARSAGWPQWLDDLAAHGPAAAAGEERGVRPLGGRDGPRPQGPRHAARFPHPGDRPAGGGAEDRRTAEAAPAAWMPAPRRRWATTRSRTNSAD